MKMNAQEFLDWESKSITLLGMSGTGKTTLANKLPKDRWFHYSGDYRIGTKYLEEAILDNIKQQAMDVPFLRNLLLSDSIYICSNITVENLAPVSSFLGKIGNTEQGGLSYQAFIQRQKLHHSAETAAMRDVPEFILKAENIYGYKHFINDAGGSVCELNDPATLELLAQHTLIIYLKASPALEKTIIERAKQTPKPLYYPQQFLDQKLAEYMDTNVYQDIQQVPPDDFVSWVFPELFRSRLPNYQHIAEQYGYIIDADEAAEASNEKDFIDMIASAIRKS